MARPIQSVASELDSSASGRLATLVVQCVVGHGLSHHLSRECAPIIVVALSAKGDCPLARVGGGVYNPGYAFRK